MFDLPPASRHSRSMMLISIVSAWLCLIVRIERASCAAASPPMRYEVATSDGRRQPAQRITAWEPERQSLRLDNRSWNADAPPLRWIIDRQSALSSQPTSWIETWTGDRLPGDVLHYADGTGGDYDQPPCLVMRSVTPTRPPAQEEGAIVRILLPWVRRIVWHNEGRRYESSTACTRDGRRIAFRALRFNSDSVTLLTGDGRQTFGFPDLSELNLPRQSPWPLLVNELALIAPNGTEQLMQFETAAGVVVTASWQRQRVARPQDPTKAANWMHAVQPAWSLDVLWLGGDDIPVRRFFRPHELPLSRLRPVEVVQQSPIAGNGRPWQLNRSVDGQWLQSGPGRFGWGFGVHAHNELHFELPPLATAVEAWVGIDALAGSGGCIQAAIAMQTHGIEQRLFQTPVVVGSPQVYSTGRLPLPGTGSRVRDSRTPSRSGAGAAAATERQLVLQVDHAHQQRPRGADPLDVRDSTDWLDPLLYLDRDALHGLIQKESPSHLFACRHWQWRLPPETQLHFQNVWDDMTQAEGHFALAVAVEGSQPARLLRRLRGEEIGQRLLLTVSCPLRTNPKPRMEVLANGTSLATFEVPVLDREHLQLNPQSVPLQGIDMADGEMIELEIRQYPGPLESPVQYHAIEFL